MKLRICLGLFLVPVLAVAQGNSTGGSTLKLPQHALTAALSDLGTIEVGRLEASDVNPAALSSSDPSTRVAFTHMSWIQGITGQRLGLDVPTRLGRFSATVAISRVPGIELRESPGPAIGTFDARMASIRAGWASTVTDGIEAGIAASYLYEKLYVNESTGFALDAGVLAKTPVDGLVVGVSAVNVGGMSAFRTESVELPATIRLAAGYLVDMGTIAIRPAVAFRTGMNHEDSGLTMGGSVLYDDLIGVRASWRSGETSRSLAIGLTASLRGIGLEYALVPFSNGLGTAQVLTFGVSF